MPFYPLPGWAGLAVAAAAVLALLYLAAVSLLFVMQRRIIFHPSAERPVLARAEVTGLQEITLATADGLALLAWYLPGREGAPVVLYLHGNGGHVGHRSERVRAFAARGWGAMLVSYRGYGGNPGSPTEAGLNLDAAAGLAALRARGAAEAEIVVWGESLGSGLASALAARHRFGAVVLETPYTSLADIARRRYPFVPVDLLLRDRFDSLVHVPAIQSPVLVLVAGRDAVVPPDMGRAIHAAARGPAELWVAAEAGHNDIAAFGGVEEAADFVRRHMTVGALPGGGIGATVSP